MSSETPLWPLGKPSQLLGIMSAYGASPSNLSTGSRSFKGLGDLRPQKARCGGHHAHNTSCQEPICWMVRLGVKYCRFLSTRDPSRHHA